MFVTTRSSVILYRSLDLRILSRCQDLRDPRLLPPHFRDSLVQDPRGLARLLRICEDNLDTVKNFPLVGRGVEGIGMGGWFGTW